MEKLALAWPDPEGVKELGTFLLPSGERVILGTARFPQGRLIPERGFSLHQGSELSLLLEGSLEVEVEGRETGDIIRAGEVTFIPAGVPHRAKVLQPTLLVWVWIETGREEDGQADIVD
ncbi:MAG: cupin domain-containing protein [Nitrososphaerota archaeon]|uniref:cupin domain-containing protein n=1 Tax=Thermus thermophilus TaxID=274 RepID=UPI0009DB1B00|nr:cupin domain-containing protein [Thermus thermophilus]